MESANVNFDECIEIHEDESMKKLEEYKSFVYFYEQIPIEKDVANKVLN